MNEHFVAATESPPVIAPETLMDDPHARFAALRTRHPLIQLGEGHYMVLRAADVLAMLTDRRTIQIEGADYARLNKVPDGFAADFIRDFFLFGNGDDHRTKRRLFARSFAHGAIRAAQPRIRAVADKVVAELPRGESFDFVERMAARVPAEMIAAMLGLPQSEASHFARHVYDLARAFTPVYPHAQHDDIENAAAHLFAYVEEHMRARLDAPQDDLLSTLVADWQADPAISFKCLVNQVIGIIIGGSDTTRAAFAMLVALLVQHPEAWAAIQADPALIPGAVAEGLRYEPSVGSVARFTTAAIDIGNVSLPAGVVLRVSTLSAMRDPDLYAEPERFDIRRQDHPRLHLVFGTGPHRCIGEMLARLEMQEGLAALVSAVSAIEMEEAPRMLGFASIRQITPMSVRIH
jgi:cytochrome P450 family 103